ncbi:MAG: tetratricopeptide repeat protein [Candidatus Delongbacteria bacterium]|nr:tetratricopeptide repeat protein [Candidatus Delongbacteria bacterium]MBN2834950.1 tetratricopeptide repeat protein [Candidatus Delongbacteria bacterium]
MLKFYLIVICLVLPNVWSNDFTLRSRNDLATITKLMNDKSTSVVIRLKYSLLASSYAEQSNDSLLLAQSMKSTGDNYRVLGLLNKSIIYLRESSLIYLKIGRTFEALSSKIEIGDILFNTESYSLAETEYLEILSFFPILHDNNLKARAIIGLGQAYRKLKKYNLALRYLKEGIELISIEENPDLYADLLSRLSFTYMDMDEYEEAEQINLDILKKMANRIDDNTTGKIYNNLGWCRYKVGDYEKSIEYNKQAYEYRKKTKLGSNVASSSLINLGNVYLELDSMEQAYKCYTKAITLLDTLYSLDSYINRRRAYEKLSLLHTKKGEFKEALNSYIRYAELRDSTDDKYRLQDYYKQLIEDKITEISYSSKDNTSIQNESLKENYYLYYASFSVLFFVNIYLIYRIRKDKKEKKDVFKISNFTIDTNINNQDLSLSLFSKAIDFNNLGVIVALLSDSEFELVHSNNVINTIFANEKFEISCLKNVRVLKNDLKHIGGSLYNFLVHSYQVNSNYSRILVNIGNKSKELDLYLNKFKYGEREYVIFVFSSFYEKKYQYNKNAIFDLLSGIFYEVEYFKQRSFDQSNILEKDNEFFQKNNSYHSILKKSVIQQFDFIEYFGNMVHKINKRFNLKLELNINVEEIVFFGDKQQLEILLFELLENSFENNDIRSKLKINVNLLEVQDVNTLEIEFISSDNPISYEDSERIFRACYSLNNKRGLGLFICRIIMDHHNGTIDIDSDYKEGSKFILRFNIDTQDKFLEKISQI